MLKVFEKKTFLSHFPILSLAHSSTFYPFKDMQVDDQQPRRHSQWSGDGGDEDVDHPHQFNNHWDEKKKEEAIFHWNKVRNLTSASSRLSSPLFFCLIGKKLGVRINFFLIESEFFSSSVFSEFFQWDFRIYRIQLIVPWLILLL